jgi:hypothetical protein
MRLDYAAPRSEIVVAGIEALSEGANVITGGTGLERADVGEKKNVSVLSFGVHRPISVRAFQFPVLSGIRRISIPLSRSMTVSSLEGQASNRPDAIRARRAAATQGPAITAIGFCLDWFFIVYSLPSFYRQRICRAKAVTLFQT